MLRSTEIQPFCFIDFGLEGEIFHPMFLIVIRVRVRVRWMMMMMVDDDGGGGVDDDDLIYYQQIYIYI